MVDTIQQPPNRMLVLGAISCFAHWVDRRAAGFLWGGEHEMRAAASDLVRAPSSPAPCFLEGLKMG